MKYIDLHTDALTKTEGVLQVTREYLEKGGCYLQCFAAFIEARENRFARAVALCERFDEMCAREGYNPVCTLSDLREGAVNALLTVEEGGAIEGNLEKLEALYRRGVRLITLVWNYENEIGFPNLHLPQSGTTERSDHVMLNVVEASPHYKKGDISTRGKGAAARYDKSERRGGYLISEPCRLPPDFTAREMRGMKPFGFEVVRRMQELKMLVDVSHASDGVFWDVAHLSKAAGVPFVASHSNAEAVCPWARNLLDEQIKALADCGGVMGLNFCPDFLGEDHSAEGMKNAILAHAKHIIHVGGEDVLALGSDFDGIPENAYMKNAACMPRLLEDFAAAFGARITEKIAYGNALRVLKEVLGDRS